jgi:hypothetical protein
MGPEIGYALQKERDMANVTYMKNVAARRAVNRNRNYANTLVHYLGVNEALKVCQEKMWHSVYQAIVEQHEKEDVALERVS